MRSYETVVVLDSKLEDDPIEEQIAGVEQLITSNKGEIVSTERWGRRKLSYPLKDRQQGYYSLFRYNADQSVPIELGRIFKLNESVLRHMTIRIKKHNVPAPSNIEEAPDAGSR